MEILSFIPFIVLVLFLIWKLKTHYANPYRLGNMISNKFTISKKNPKYDGKNVEFVSVQKNGTATLKTMFSSEIVTAKPQCFFVGNDYGTHGLKLLSSSFERQEIQLEHFLLENIECD
ncbi:MAG: hypothetical protein D3923_01890 [Candidatus Electrothrix sp. AR3]|nr:hypothetical protein [Candidatus Electrothrix sp. AR3]